MNRARTATVAALVLLAAACGPSEDPPRATPTGSAVPAASRERVLVRTDAPSALETFHRAMGVTRVTPMREPDTYLIDVAGSRLASAGEYLERLRAQPVPVREARVYSFLVMADQKSDAPASVKVHFRDDAEIDELVSQDLDFVETKDDEAKTLEALLTEDEFWMLSDAGFELEVDREHTLALEPSFDVFGPQLFSEESDERMQTFNGGYRNVEDLYASLSGIQSRYPNLAQVVVYGASYAKLAGGVTTPRGDRLAGYDLEALKITNRSIPGPKPVFLLMANIHAREITTPEIAMRMADWLTQNYATDADAHWLVDAHEIWIIPTANPDGLWHVELGTLAPYNRTPFMWRKNGDPKKSCTTWPPTVSSHYGVDTNRNFDFKWGGAGTTSSACGQMYRGASAASEPEARALQDLVERLFADRRGSADADVAAQDTSGIFIQLHSYGNVVSWPWGYTKTPSPNETGMSRIGLKMASYNGYKAGATSRAIYATSGSADDFAYGVLGVPSYTFEIGGAFMPPYSDVSSKQWPSNKPAFLYAAKIARAPYALAEGPEASAVSAVQTPGAIAVSAQIDDRKNGNQIVGGAAAYVDTPPWASGAIARALASADGKLDASNEQLRGSLSLGTLAPGRHVVYVQGWDAAGHRGAVSAQFVEIAAPAAPLALEDAGFELPAVGDYKFNPTQAGWTFEGNSGVQKSGGPGFKAAAAPSGVQTGFIEGKSPAAARAGIAGSSMSQSFWVETAARYVVSMKAARRSWSPDGPQPLRIRIDGALVATLTPASAANFSTIATPPKSLARGSHVLTIEATNLGLSTSFIDQVAIARFD
jgi:hypothetical protein